MSGKPTRHCYEASFIVKFLGEPGPRREIPQGRNAREAIEVLQGLGE